jgi:hypothetical protein
MSRSACRQCRDGLEQPLDRIAVKVAEGSLVAHQPVLLDDHDAVRVVVHGLCTASWQCDVPGVPMTEAPIRWGTDREKSCHALRRPLSLKTGT